MIRGRIITALIILPRIILPEFGHSAAVAMWSQADGFAVNPFGRYDSAPSNRACFLDERIHGRPDEIF